MTYATRQDLTDRFGADEVSDISDAAKVDAALADASAEIDSRLATAFALPLGGGPWPLLRSIACDLARAGLYDEAPTKTVLRRKAAALRRLAEVADGDRALLSETGEVAGRTAFAAGVGAGKVEFTDEALEGL